MSISPPIPGIDAGFTSTQQRYLEGFFAGINARGVTFGDIAPTSVAESKPSLEDLTKEERIKREQHPFEALETLVMNARGNRAPESEDVFRFKWNGLFWLNPVKDSYMCRLRIPGGAVKSHQLRETAAIARELTSGYIQITTRNNLQIRTIQPKDCPEVLRRIQACGLHSRGAGGDNIRNITTNPTAGIDPYELIDTMPLVNELATIIVSGSEFYDLPRKFNIAFDGGGLVSSVEDTNDIGCTAVEILSNEDGIDPGIYFRLCLGGVTGHQTFAADAGVLVSSTQVNQVILAILRVFIRDGDRTNRKKARLKYILEDIGIPAFVVKVEELLKFKLPRFPIGWHEKPRSFSQQNHGHVGVFPQKQPNQFYVGASVPVGQVTAKQLERIAYIADTFGNGEVRLTVWQNFIIPNVTEAFVPTVCKQLKKLGFDTTQSHLRSGFVACTGNRYCKFAATDTKGHAIAMMEYLDKRVKLDQPVNIHFTGCPHSCAQHFMGDIGLLGAKVKLHGETVEGYHITVGGGFGENRKVGRQIFNNVSFRSLGGTLEAMLKGFLAKRQDAETFHTFCNRHTVRQLQEAFADAC